MITSSPVQADWAVDSYRCPAAEMAELNDLIDELAAEHPSASDRVLIERAPLLAHRLPHDLREFLLNARIRESSPAYAVTCPGIADGIGPTPPDWWTPQPPAVTVRQEIALILMSALLGDVFAWATQQDGRMIHDIMPIAGHENQQLGSSSLTPLSWHTEDAFHPYRGDYIALACLRNPGQVPTALLAVDRKAIPERTMRLLREKRYLIMPDNSHLPGNNPASRADSGLFSGIQEMISDPDPVAAVFGPLDSLYIRVDPDFMRAVPGDSDATAALREFFALIEEHLIDVVLEAGDFLFVDNFRTAHGRRSFIPRYDGTDRWLKRVNISRDLRPARAVGACRGFRTMY